MLKATVTPTGVGGGAWTIVVGAPATCNSGWSGASAVQLDHRLLEMHFALVALPGAVASQQPRVRLGVEGEVEQTPHLAAAGGIRQPDQHLDATVQVAVHEVGGADPGLWLAGVGEPEHPAVLEESSQHRAHLDV